MMDSVDFRTLRRPRSPNTYLLAPDGLCENARPDDVSAVFPVSREVLFGEILKRIEARPDWHLTANDPDRGMIGFVAVSKLMRFKDDVDILVLPAEAGDPQGRQGSRLAAYSRSRVGHSDLGANKKRISQLLASLRDVQVGT